MRGRHHKKRTKERRRRARKREELLARGERELEHEHHDINLMGTTTGRTQSKFPNFAAIPRGAPIRLLEEDSLKGFYEHFHVEKKAAAVSAMDWGKLLHTIEEAKLRAQETQTPLLLSNQPQEPQGHLAPRRGRARTCHVALGVVG